MLVKAPPLEYRDRLLRRETEVARLDLWDRRLGDARLAAVALAIGIAWPTLISQAWSPIWLAAPLAAFIALVLAHGPIVAAAGRQRLSIAFYRRGLARIAGEWDDPLDDGVSGRVDAHPYVEDLDLFGPGSLYALLCTAYSLPGRKALADWLSGPAAPAEIGGRQEAVAELAGRLDLQEDLALLAADLAPEVSAESLDGWGSGATQLGGRTVPLVAALLGIVNLVTISAWLFGPLAGRMALPVFAVSGVLVFVLRRRVSQVLAGLAVPAGELRFLARTLSRIESESFVSPRLCDLQRRAGSATERPSGRLVELARLIEWNDSRGNLLFQPVAALLLLGTQLAFAVERWRVRHGNVVGDWLRTIGEFEALSALATFSYENPEYVFPTIVEGPPLFEGDDLGHPLLPRTTRVANSLRLGGGEAGSPLRLLLVSGSNMSGKSTLLRTVGVAAVLALAGAPVPARRLRLTPLAIGASIQLHDSLLEGVSRFYGELQRLRRIRDLAVAGPVLFLLDEILHGTNSHDRRLGAAGVIHGLLEAGAIGLVTTHDLALAEIAEELAPAAANVHFSDHLEAGRMTFDYRLRTGAVERGNALALMRSLGLPVEEE
jgi:hypothetical protein